MMRNTNRFDRVRAAIDRHPAITDAAIAVVICLLALLTLGLNWERTQPLPGSVAVLLTILLIAPLTWRRRFPLAVLALMTPLAILIRIVDLPEAQWTTNALWLAAYSAGAYGNPRWRTPVRAAAFALLAGWIVYDLFAGDHAGIPGNRYLFWALALLANAAVMIWIWWFGDVMYVRRQRETELAERTRQLDRERETNARRAVLDERVRIARELHDVVAHHVSLMGVQAGAARRVLATRPEQAEAALTAIETASRQAVQELHRLLGFLRQDRDTDGLAPQPGMRQLDALLTQMRDAGLPVALEIEGKRRTLPPAVDLSAYRIVQEALTNSLKHAGPAKATVAVRFGDRALEIEVSDDGRGAATNGDLPRGGNGLIGMRERASLLGGQLRVEQRTGSGFSVLAHLPLDGLST